MIILGIESSCDETSAAVVKDGRQLLSNVIATQIDIHKMYGGVVPEIASRKHVEAVIPVIRQALEEAKVTKDDIDAIGVTYGPGLVGALLVGLSAGKALAYAWEKPLVGVHHIEGHISASFIENKELKPPFLCLVVSGGHSHIIECRDYGDFRILGRTEDDAAGEAFDKTSRVLGLGYPGGPQIDKHAKNGNPEAIHFPRVHMGDTLDFSFSGVKTAVLNYVNKAQMMHEEINVDDVCASFQKAVTDILTENTIKAAKATGYKEIVLAGGVASNSALRASLREACDKNGFRLYYPSPVLCTDNGAMIGAAAYYAYGKNRLSGYDLNAYATLSIEGLNDRK